MKGRKSDKKCSNCSKRIMLKTYEYNKGLCNKCDRLYGKKDKFGRRKSQFTTTKNEDKKERKVLNRKIMIVAIAVLSIVFVSVLVGALMSINPTIVPVQGHVNNASPNADFNLPTNIYEFRNEIVIMIEKERLITEDPAFGPLDVLQKVSLTYNEAPLQEYESIDEVLSSVVIPMQYTAVFSGDGMRSQCTNVNNGFYTKFSWTWGGLPNLLPNTLYIISVEFNDADNVNFGVYHSFYKYTEPPTDQPPPSTPVDEIGGFEWKSYYTSIVSVVGAVAIIAIVLTITLRRR